ncbi:MAG: A/G-specific adenine glycosylase [Chloroflexota bacterium]|nr:A/G-specific adenine glycosylase [Chloroflexota bacterium]
MTTTNTKRENPVAASRLSSPGSGGQRDPVDRVRPGLLAWFAANRRDLPWRRTRDPYRILVAEVMLQQTQVDRVVPYYNAFLKRFPTMASLAAAPTSVVIKLWAGLGYNRRAVNLQRTARFVIDELDGVFPQDATLLLRLPGIGPYTAGAIACFAFEQDVAFLDTNMRRTVHRLFFGVDIPVLTATERELLEFAASIVPVGAGWEWNQALIEFGALQCTARRPACVICPVQAECKAFPEIQSVIALLPIGSRRKVEAPFGGSNRYYRGRVVDALREMDGEHPTGIDLATLGTRVRNDFGNEDIPWLYELVQGLARDGLAAVAEEKPAYDAGAPDSIGPFRVKLP